MKCLAALVAFQAGVDAEAAASFTKLIGVGDPMPDGNGSVVQIGQMAMDEGASDLRILVSLSNGHEFGAYQGLYFVDSSKKFQRVVSTATAKPGGGTFSSLNSFSVHGGKVYFAADLAQMLCKVDEPGGPVTVIAKNGDVNADGNRWAGFLWPSAHAGGVVFDAYVTTANNQLTYVDLFHYGGGPVTSLIGYGKRAVPGTASSLFYMNNQLYPRAHDGEVVFFGGGSPYVEGIFTVPLPGSDKAARRIVDTTMKPPGSTQPFTFPINKIAFDMDAGEVVFYATSFKNTNSGYYRHTAAAGIVPVVTRATPFPQGEGTFDPVAFPPGQMGSSGGKVIFAGQDAAGFAVFRHDGAGVERVIGMGDVLDGQEQGSFTVWRDGFAGDKLAMVAGGGLYLVSFGGTPPPKVSLSIARKGDVVEVSWDGIAAGAGAELQWTPSLAAPNWQAVSPKANPFQVQPQTGATQFFRLRQ